MRSPLWRHGYTVHGPQPRSYDYAFPRKKLLGALRSALAAKLADGKLTVVDTLELKEPKTKLYREALDKLDVTRTALLVENGKTVSQALMLGSRNLEGRRAGAEQRSASLRSAALRARHLLEAAIEQLQRGAEEIRVEAQARSQTEAA